MPKSKGEKSKGYISQGKHRNVSRATRRLMRAAVSPGKKLINKRKAWEKGKKVWVSIENPNKSETNRQFIRVSGDDFFGKGLPYKDQKLFIIRGEAVE
jgi:hypothetical protein